MTLSMYQASVPVFLRGLENLKAILAKGAEKAGAIASVTLRDAYERVGFVTP